MNEENTISKLLIEDKNFCRYEAAPSEISRWSDDLAFDFFKGASASPRRLPKIIENNETDLPTPVSSKFDQEYFRKLKPKIKTVAKEFILDSVNTYKKLKQLNEVKISPDFQGTPQKNICSQKRGESKMKIVVYKKLYKSSNQPDFVLTGKGKYFKKPDIYSKDLLITKCNLKDQRTILPQIRSRSTVTNFSLFNSGVPMILK